MSNRICISPILLLVVLTVSLNAQPRAGDWKAITRFGYFVLTVNSTGTEITKLLTMFSNYTFGGITQNGGVVSSPSPGWPISNNQFAFTNSINPSGTIKLTLNGTFTQSGGQAQGTWSMLVSGQTDSDTWGPVTLTSVERFGTEVPTHFNLKQNYPNPFNPSTTIQFELQNESFVSLKVFDLLGEDVATLVEGTQYAGMWQVQFDASKLVGGIYFYRLQAGDFVETKKMVLVK